MNKHKRNSIKRIFLKMIKLSNTEQFLKKIAPEESFSLNFEFQRRRSYCKFFGNLASQTLVKREEKYYFFV